MAAAVLRRMRGTVQAKLRYSPGLQVPGGLAQPLVLALLLASATLSSGKVGAAAGRSREGRAGGETGPARERALPSVLSRWRCPHGAGSLGAEEGG